MSEAAIAVETPSLLVLAALPRELAGIDRSRFPGVEFLATGMGSARATHALRERLVRGPVKAVIGLGFAGALSPQLRIGEIIFVKKSLTPHGEAIDLEPLMPSFNAASFEGVSFGTAVTSNDIAVTSLTKQSLAGLVPAGEIGIVDMESSGIAEVCMESDVKLLIARAVSDLFDEDLPVDFNRCRDGKGGVSSWKVMSEALFRRDAVRGLLDLRKRSALCARRLAEVGNKLILETGGTGWNRSF
jgi:adenosylhomocysteine nucleosidase